MNLPVHPVDSRGMRICRNMSPVPRDTFANSQRRYGRLLCQQITCSLGDVIDLSAGGMRIRAHGSMGLREGQTVGLTLQAGTQPVPLPCQVVWMRKSSWRTWEIGLMFQDLTPRARQSLSGIARAVTFQGDVSYPVPMG